MHDHDLRFALTNGIGRKTRGRVVKGWPQNKDVITGDVGVVGERQNVDALGRDRDPGGIGFLGENRTQNDLRTLFNRLYGHCCGLRGLACRVVNPQINLRAAQIGNRHPCRVLQRPCQQLITGLTRSSGNQKCNLHFAIARSADSRASGRHAGSRQQNGGGGNTSAQRLAGPVQNGQHRLSSLLAHLNGQSLRCPAPIVNLSARYSA